MTDTTPNQAPAVTTYESHLPSWQQWLNSTCENWIFAFLVAMAIRHFCVEAFRIPTASMEPMLYGDPAFGKSDHVVVDKFLFRFTGPKRWDVTVFQFPQPEIEPLPGEHTDARTAIADDGSTNGNRLDTAMLRPLMYRNFVKRAIILPGDRFYIFGGDVYLEQPDHTWAVSRKPPAVQEEMWQEVYHFGAQRGYQPWIAEGGCAVQDDAGALNLHLVDGGTVTLLRQQLRNLYLKPGIFRVRPRSPSSGADELIELSMTKPQFSYQSTRRTGVAWDLDSWEISRMTSADLDNNSEGVLLNNTMTEWVGDVRVKAAVKTLSGQVALQLNQGTLHSYELQMTPTGWRINGDGKELATGTETVLGQDVVFGHLDNQIFASIAGREVIRHDVPPVDPLLYRLEVRWVGAGAIDCAMVSMDRDVHYTLGNQGSFLRDERLLYQSRAADLESARDSHAVKAIERDGAAKMLRDITMVRAQMLGKTLDELTDKERTAAIGNSPETAITAPPGAYLMMGDNSPQSWDSRCWGWVPAENLRGRVLAVVLPFSRWRVVR